MHLLALSMQFSQGDIQAEQRNVGVDVINYPVIEIQADYKTQVLFDNKYF